LDWIVLLVTLPSFGLFSLSLLFLHKQDKDSQEVCEVVGAPTMFLLSLFV
jgi:hypothetical protein